jgi:hypothetical protein
VLRLKWRGEPLLLAANDDRSMIWSVHARKQLDACTLTRSILPEESKNLTCPQLDGRIRDCDRAPEYLGDPNQRRSNAVAVGGQRSAD